MTIGPLVPGTPTSVTPDTTTSPYASFDGPAPDGFVVADDILDVIQLALNVQSYAQSLGGDASAAVSAEATARENADDDLQDAIDAVAGDLASEVSTRGSQISALTGTVNTVNANSVARDAQIAGANGTWFGVEGRATHVDGYTLGRAAPSPVVYYYQSTASGASVTFGISDLLPAGTTLISISLLLTGSSSATALPTTLPKVQLNRASLASPDSAATLIKEETWSPVDLAAYKTTTVVTVTPTLPITILDGLMYYITLVGEEGSSGGFDLSTHAIRVVRSYGAV